MSDIKRSYPTGGTTGQSDWVMLATHRCGSTWLSDLLSLTDVAGKPNVLFPRLFDYSPSAGFRTDIRAEDDRTAALSVRVPPIKVPHADLFAEARAGGTSANGVFATKLMWPDLIDLGSYLDREPDAALLRLLTPGLRCVRVTREDKDAQAVSYFKGLLTGAWQSHTKGAPVSEPAYDFDLIDFIHEVLVAHERAWERWCMTNGIRAHTLTYDQLVSNPTSTVTAVLEFIGVQARAPLPGSTLEQQADDLSARWLERFRRDRRQKTGGGEDLYGDWLSHEGGWRVDQKLRRTRSSSRAACRPTSDRGARIGPLSPKQKGLDSCSETQQESAGS